MDDMGGTSTGGPSILVKSSAITRVFTARTPYTCVFAGSFGRVWTRRPTPTPTGLTTTFNAALQGNRPATFTSVAFAEDGATLATVDNRGRVYATHVRQNRYALLANVHHAGTAMTFGRAATKSSVFVAFADRTVRVFDTTSSATATLAGHRCAVTALSVSPDGRLLVSQSNDSLILWDARTLARLRVLGAGPYGAQGVAFSPRDESIVTAFRNGEFWVWDARRLTLKARLGGAASGDDDDMPSPSYACFAVSPKRRWLAAGSASTPHVSIFDLAQPDHPPRHLAVPRLEGGGISHISFLADGTTAVLACADGHVRVLGCENQSLLGDFAPGDACGCVDALAVRSDGRYAAVVTTDGTSIELWDLVRHCASTNPKSVGTATATEVAAAARAMDDANTIPPPGVVGAMRAKPRPAPSWTQPASDAAIPTGSSHVDETAIRAPAPERLQSLLQAYGEFPARYRTFIWRTLLQCPQHHEAFDALGMRGIHPAYESLNVTHPIDDKAVFGRLQRTLSKLAHWSEVFAETAYLPALVFPFVKLFGADELTCFESLATLLSSWFGDWCELYPAPPMPALQAIEHVLAHHDGGLYDTLVKVGKGQPTKLIWTLMQTSLSEVFAQREWCKVWDHCMASDVAMVGFVAVAFLILMRENLIRCCRGQAGSAPPPDEVMRMCRRPCAVDTNGVIRLAYALRQSTPDALMPVRRAAVPLGKRGASYPEFTHYPVKAVNLAAAERERIAAEEAALLTRKRIAQGLAERNAALASLESEWNHERVRLAELERERNAEAARRESELLSERRAADDRNKEERLRQIELIESSRRAQLLQMRQTRELELARLKESAERTQSRMASDLRASAEEHALRSLELQAQQRMAALEDEEAQAEALKVAQSTVDTWVAQNETRRVEKEAEWNSQDAEDALRRKYVLARRARVAKKQEEDAARSGVEVELHRRERDYIAEMAKVERERALQRAAIEEEAKTAAVIEEREQRERIHSERAKLELGSALEELRASQKGSEMGRLQRLEEARSAREHAISARDELEAKVLWEKRKAELLMAIKREQVNMSNAAAKDVRTAMLESLQLDQARKLDEELIAETLKAAKESRSRIDRASSLLDAQKSTEEDERSRFRKLREELLDRVAALDGENGRQHEAVMTALTVERERQLMELDAAWRKRVQREELSGLQAEAAAQEAARQQREEFFKKRERALAEDIERIRGEARPDPPADAPTTTTTTTTDDDDADGAARAAAAAARVAAAAAARAHDAAGTESTTPLSGMGASSMPTSTTMSGETSPLSSGLTSSPSGTEGSGEN
ncbi:TBC1 domain family member 31 [Pseudoscourfieldia marina]